MGGFSDSNSSDQNDNSIVVLADKDDGSKRTKVDGNGSISTILKDAVGTDVGTASNPLRTRNSSISSTGNSSTTPLIANGVFTGAWEDVRDYAVVTFTIISNVSSATNGISLQWSSDGVNVDRSENSSLTGGTGRAFSLTVRGRYFRIVYTNGTSAQATFRLGTDYHVAGSGIVTRPLSQSITDSNFAQLVTSVITGKSTDSSYVPLKSSGVSIGNTSATPLAANATFTGAWEEVIGYTNISIMVNTDQASATDGWRLEYSTNGVDIDDNDFYTVPASNGQAVTVGVNSRYFRVRFTNGTVAQTSFRLQTIYHITAPKPSSHRIDDRISGQNDAELSKSVFTGKNPNGLFDNVRVQGVHDGNSTTTPLAAGEIYRGTWFAWQESYSKLVVDMKSDVSGILMVDFSESVTPTNGVDTDVDKTTTITYNPASTPLLQRQVIVQSRWVRLRYGNGVAAQTTFVLDTAFLTGDPGLGIAPLAIQPDKTSLAGLVRSVQTIPTADGTGYRDTPVSPTTGNPVVDISNLKTDILLKPLTSALAGQITVGTTPVRIDPVQVANRRSTMISNDGPNNCSIGFSNAITYETSSIRMVAGAVRIFPFSEAVKYWAIAENVGGTQTILTRSGASSAGTGTTPANALTSNNVYAAIGSAAQTVEVFGYTAGTTNDLVAVKIGMEASKQTGQTETVAFQDVKTGSNTSSSGVVSTSTAVTAATNHLYIAAIGREANPTVTMVTGMGLTWTKLLQQNSDDNNRAIDIWYAQGTPTGNEVVTASFATSASLAHISVSRFSNVSTTTPIQASVGANGNSATPATAGIAGTNKGMALMAVEFDNATTFTPGAGYTTTSQEFGNEGIAVMRKALTATATETPTSTISSSKRWAAISLTLTPLPAIDPLVTLSYTLSGVAGATTGLATITSSTDTNFVADITPDRPWTFADIANLRVIATGTTIGSALANIDYLYVELTDTTGSITRVSVVQGGEAT